MQKKPQRTPKPQKPQDFGDFASEEQKKIASVVTAEPQTTRTRLPRENQIIGIVVQRFGGNRMEIKCADGKVRNGRVPGRFKRSLWLRINDVILLEAWEHDSEKGDIVYRYNPGEVNQLRKRNLLPQTETSF